MAKQSIVLELVVAGRDQLSTVVRTVQARLAALRAGVAGFISSALRMRNLLIGGLGLLGVSLTANAAIASFRNLVEELDRAGKAAQSFGLADAEFLKLQYAAERTGANFESLRIGLTKLQQAAAQGNPALDQLGISLDGLSNTEMLARVAGAFAGVTSSAERTALAVRLFGEQGTKLLPLLESDLAAISARFDELGGDSIARAVPYAEQLKEAFGELGVAVMALKSDLLIAFGPELQATVTAIANAIAKNRQEIVDSIGQMAPSIDSLFTTIRVGGPVVIVTLAALQDAIKGVSYAVLNLSKTVVDFRIWAGEMDQAMFSAIGMNKAIAETNERLTALHSNSAALGQSIDEMNNSWLNSGSALERAGELSAQWVEAIKMIQSELGASITLARENAEELERLQPPPAGEAFVRPSGALGAITGWKEATDAATVGAQTMSNALQATQSNFEGFFQGILDGSTSAKDAIKTFASAMIDALIRVSAQLLATITLALLLNALTGGGFALAGGLGGFIGSFGSGAVGGGASGGASSGAGASNVSALSPRANLLPSPDMGRGGQGSVGGMVQVVNISAVDAFSLKRLLEGEGQTLSEIVANQIPGSYSMSNVLGG
jgi:hypothetical protein